MTAYNVKIIKKFVKMKYFLEDNLYDRFFTGKERHSNQNLSSSECLYQNLQSNAMRRAGSGVAKGTIYVLLLALQIFGPFAASELMAIIHKMPPEARIQVTRLSKISI